MFIHDNLAILVYLNLLFYNLILNVDILVRQLLLKDVFEVKVGRFEHSDGPFHQLQKFFQFSQNFLILHQFLLNIFMCVVQIVYN